jgi:hypothetical protein
LNCTINDELARLRRALTNVSNFFLRGRGVPSFSLVDAIEGDDSETFWWRPIKPDDVLGAAAFSRDAR